MLASAQRLRTAEVEEILKKGRTVRGGLLSVKFLTKKGVFRAAAVVSKKLAKTAVRRNQVRRALYGALRASPLPQGTAAVCIVHTMPQKPLSANFRRDIETICSKHFS